MGIYLFFKKLSCTQNANPFIMTGTMTITTTNSKFGYASIHPNRIFDIVSRIALNTNYNTNSKTLATITIEFQINSCRNHAL